MAVEVAQLAVALAADVADERTVVGVLREVSGEPRPLPDKFVAGVAFVVGGTVGVRDFVAFKCIRGFL